MLKTALIALIAIALCCDVSAVFVGRNEGKIHEKKRPLILGANKCTRGPGYWCQNLTTVHECGAIEHCANKHWNTMKLPKDSSDYCQKCETTLADFEKAMNSSTTKVAIESVIFGLCSVIPVHAVTYFCKETLIPLSSELRSLIVNNIDPQVICHTIHFCNNDEGTETTFKNQALLLSVVQPLGPVIITGNSEALVGQPKVAPLTCSDGQVYWCKNMENAKECNAVEHCKQVVWKHQKNSPTPVISDINDSTASPKTVATPSTTTALDVFGYSKVNANSEECSKGQTFWCENIVTAGSCKAVPHCIQSVWSHMKVQQDKDSVCQICKDMVKQARDQLTSNETQSDLKAVFEGSCNLMPVKIIREGCDRLVEEFVPELIEVLSSQMNPDVVCSVAGLCNNGNIDKLLTTTTSTTTSTTTPKPNADCQNCADLASKLRNNFNSASKKDVLNVLNNFCSELSTFSDMCTNLIRTHEDILYKSLQNYFTTGLDTDRHYTFSILNMCWENKLCTKSDMSAKSLSTSSTGISVELNHNSESGVVSHESKDDLPCDLCQQLVHHLKDILIANTTETEFKQVLEGICKQTGAFASQCQDLVNQYYNEVYSFLTKELDAQFICGQVGLCPKKKTIIFSNLDLLVPVVPMPIEPVNKLPSHVQGFDDDNDEVTVASKVITPVAPSIMVSSSKNPACTMCEYILHFVQEQVADTTNEKAILKVMDEACNQMPGEFAKECDEFVQEYGKAFVALVIQQIDPSQVCPKLKICDNAVSIPQTFAESTKGLCPLCLLATQAIEQQVLNNRTIENIRKSLDKICSSLSKQLAEDCNQFVNNHYDELLDMLVAEINPQEMCVYLKLCLPPKRTITAPAVDKSKIPSSSSSSSKEVPAKDSQACIMCEFVMTNLDHILKDKKTEEEIKHAVHSVCKIMPKSVRQECDDFINEYADLVIQLLSQSLEPKEVCQALGICKDGLKQEMIVKMTDCAMCKEVMNHLDDTLADSTVKDSDKEVLDKVCYHVNKTIFNECNKFILKYGTKILTLLPTTQSYQICQKLKICTDTESKLTHIDISVNEVSSEEHNQDNVKLAIIGAESDICNTYIGFTVCKSQLFSALMLTLALSVFSLAIIMFVARAIQRKRLARGFSTPYEQLYQPTTVPTRRDYIVS